MNCSSPPPISAPPPANTPPIGQPSVTAGGPATPPAPTTAPSAPAADAVAGANGGALATQAGPTTAAVAGATGAVGTDQLVATLQQLITTITALVTQLQSMVAAQSSGGAAPVPVTSGGGALGAPPAPVPGDTTDVKQRPAKDSSRNGGAKGAPDTQTHGSAPGGGAPGAGSANAARWVTGDTKGLNPTLLDKLAQVGEKMGQKISISSGKRSYQEQVVLYQKYLNGTGNLAAKPGTSNHESGNAADVNIGRVSLRDNAKAAAYARQIGLTFPVPSESWHVELAH